MNEHINTIHVLKTVIHFHCISDKVISRFYFDKVTSSQRKFHLSHTLDRIYCIQHQTVTYRLYKLFKQFVTVLLSRCHFHLSSIKTHEEIKTKYEVQYFSVQP